MKKISFFILFLCTVAMIGCELFEMEIYGSGSLAIQGIICTEEVDLETTTEGSHLFIEMFGDCDRDLEITTDDGEIGFQIENPELLASDTVFSVSEIGFILEGNHIAEYCDLGEDEDEIPVSSGSVTIEIYDGERLQGSFDVELRGEDITGTFDILFEESLLPYFE